MKLNTIEELIEDIRQGRMVILMDDEDRENEGDLVIAAERVRAEDVNRDGVLTVFPEVSVDPEDLRSRDTVDWLRANLPPKLNP